MYFWKGFIIVRKEKKTLTIKIIQLMCAKDSIECIKPITGGIFLWVSNTFWSDFFQSQYSPHSKSVVGEIKWDKICKNSLKT